MGEWFYAVESVGSSGDWLVVVSGEEEDQEGYGRHMPEYVHTNIHVKTCHHCLHIYQALLTVLSQQCGCRDS